MSEVWIHWNAGEWLVTSDGLHLLEKARELALAHVRFVIDPVGLELMRERRRRTTCAWAIGQRVDPRFEVRFGGAIHRIEFLPARDDHFQVLGARVSGCRYLYATLGLDGEPRAACMTPHYGDTERRKVQQYGGRPTR